MEFYVDIADIERVRAVNEYFPIDGFTTNPSILTRTDRPLAELFGEYRDYVRQTRQRIFVQGTAQDADGMVRQAEKLGD